jgi:hypothetical protein
MTARNYWFMGLWVYGEKSRRVESGGKKDIFFIHLLIDTLLVNPYTFLWHKDMV